MIGAIMKPWEQILINTDSIQFHKPSRTKMAVNQSPGTTVSIQRVKEHLSLKRMCHKRLWTGLKPLNQLHQPNNRGIL